MQWFSPGEERFSGDGSAGEVCLDGEHSPTIATLVAIGESWVIFETEGRGNAFLDRLRARRGFVTVTGTFVFVMAFATVPTPLYGLYQARNGFAEFTVTLAFGAYAVGVVVGLLLVGHVSDRIGRRQALLGGVALEVACAGMFMFLADTGSLLFLRFLSGLGVAAFSTTAAAALPELHARWRPQGDPAVAHAAANVGNLGGLAVGPAVAGVLPTRRFHSSFRTPSLAACC